MATIISVALQKGGTAKTTTAINLSADLGARNYKVLLIDMDSQANTTFASGIDSKNLKNSLYNVLTPEKTYNCNIDNAILSCKYYDLLPADKDVIDLTLELKAPDILRKLLECVQDSYDYIIIDTPPQLNIVTLNAFVASNYIIIPTEPKPFNFTGLVDLKDTIDEVKKNFNPSLKVLGILLVRYNPDARGNLKHAITDMIDNYANQLGTTRFDQTIREGICVPESQINQQVLIDYDAKANPTVDYKLFTTDVLKRLESDK